MLGKLLPELPPSGGGGNTYYETIALSFDEEIQTSGGLSFQASIDLNFRGSEIPLENLGIFESIDLSFSEDVTNETVLSAENGIGLSMGNTTSPKGILSMNATIDLAMEDVYSDSLSTPYTESVDNAASFSFASNGTLYPKPQIGNIPPSVVPPKRATGPNRGLNGPGGYSPQIMNPVQTLIQVVGTGQSLSSGVFTNLTFPTVTTDYLNEWASPTYTAQQKGVYSLILGFSFTTLPASFSFAVEILVNGSAIYSETMEGQQFYLRSIPLSLNPGDTVECAVNPNSAVSVASQAALSISRSR